MKPALKKIKIKASVIGASGYSGLELLKLLNNHKCVDIGIATSNTYSGQAVSDVFPSFNDTDNSSKADPLFFVPITGLKEESFYSSDVVFLCLPSLASMEFVNKYLANYSGAIIDIGSDFRIKDEKDFELWYGKPHIAGKLLKEFVYGLPEIYEEKIKASRYIANPGCYPTSVLLALAPLLLCKDLDIANINIDSKSGVTGAGRKLKNDYLFCSVNENFFAYSPIMHRHTGEIEQELSIISGKSIKVCFTPHLLPLNRGIFTSIYCNVKSCIDGSMGKSLQAVYANKGLEISPEINMETGPQVSPGISQGTCCEISPHISSEINSGADLRISQGTSREIISESVYNPDYYRELKEKILGLYKTYYSNAPFVRFLGEKIPQLKDAVGTNFCLIGIALDERTGTLKIFSTIDNLLKGAAGQAVQNMNLIFNFDQKEGLSGYGIFS